MKQLEAITDHQSVDIQALKEVFIAQGYLFIKSFFPEESVLSLRKAITDGLVLKGWGSFEGDTLIPSDPPNRIGSEPFYDCLTHLMSKEEVHLWAYQEKLQALLAGLLGETVFAHPRKMIRISYPLDSNPKDLIPAHQDVYYVRGETDTFTVWTPLGNYSPSDGGLEVAHNSHRQGIFPVGGNEEGRFNCSVADVDHADFDWRVGNYEVGDVLIMHSLALHKARPNQSETFRLSLDCRFSSSSGVLNSDQLVPPYYPNLPGWDKLSKGWSQPDLFSVPDTLRVDAPDMSLEEMMAKPSIIEACHGSC